MEMPWILFDGDNTLWHVEHLYDEARVDLCQHLEKSGISAEEVDRYQRDRDKELHGVYGYSASRFARSFRDTVLHFLPGTSENEVQSAESLALQVFERRGTVDECLEAVINTLKDKFRLGILTAGERWVQERRLNQFEFRDKFFAVEIVTEKNKDTFSVFCSKYKVSVSESWMVGDSPRSDILPAIGIGLKAVLLRSNNWQVVEDAALPRSIPIINSMQELVRAIAA